MKQFISIISFLFAFTSNAQVPVPEKYWIADSNFEEKIKENHAFGDDNKLPIVVEFWASFNDVSLILSLFSYAQQYC